MPFQCVNGRFVSVEQGSARHLQDQAEVTLRTRPGMLEDDPSFGLRDLAATLGPASPEVIAALDEFVDTRFLVDEDQDALLTRVRIVTVDLQANEDGGA